MRFGYDSDVTSAHIIEQVTLLLGSMRCPGVDRLSKRDMTPAACLCACLRLQTMLVEKVAAEAELHLLSISPSMILSKWSGDSEKAISQVFDLARTMQPALLFMVSHLTLVRKLGRYHH